MSAFPEDQAAAEAQASKSKAAALHVEHFASPMTYGAPTFGSHIGGGYKDIAAQPEIVSPSAISRRSISEKPAHIDAPHK